MTEHDGQLGPDHIFGLSHVVETRSAWWPYCWWIVEVVDAVCGMDLGRLERE